MNKEEIQRLIRKTIRGQGSAVDVGSRLADILESIVELVPDEGTQTSSDVVLPVNDRITGNPEELTNTSFSELENALAIEFNNTTYPRMAIADFYIGSDTSAGKNFWNAFGDYEPDSITVFGWVYVAADDQSLGSYNCIVFFHGQDHADFHEGYFAVHMEM